LTGVLLAGQQLRTSAAADAAQCSSMHLHAPVLMLLRAQQLWPQLLISQPRCCCKRCTSSSAALGAPGMLPAEVKLLLYQH
jgi:hypothetical protein